MVLRRAHIDACLTASIPDAAQGCVPRKPSRWQSISRAGIDRAADALVMQSDLLQEASEIKREVPRLDVQVISYLQQL